MNNLVSQSRSLNLSIDGKIDNIHDFPVTISNIFKCDNQSEIINELYHINLDKPDYSNFENYVISRIGKSFYELYFRNYNIKQWKILPSEMDAEWAKFKTFTLREKPDIFKGKWQGHPGNYNPMWHGMLENVELLKGEAKISENFKEVYINNEKVNYDVIISTFPVTIKTA